MRTINIKVNDTDYEFICDSRGTRYGFAHDCHLMVDCVERAIAHCYYLDRTWERWDYQTVCIKAIDELINTLADRKKSQFKADKGYKRMTAKRELEFNEILKCSPDLHNLKVCKEQLQNNLY